MILEAEKNVAADINLNKLVDDYRSSLLVYNFEKRLVDQMLNTIITMDEKGLLDRLKINICYRILFLSVLLPKFLQKLLHLKEV